MIRSKLLTLRTGSNSGTFFIAAQLIQESIRRNGTTASSVAMQSCSYVESFFITRRIVSYSVHSVSYPVYTIQPVVRRFYNRFDNRVERTATVRSTGCHTGLYNRFDNRLYTRYGRLSNRLSNGFDNRLNVCIHNTTGCQSGLI